MAQAMAIQEIHLSSFITAVDERLNNLMNAVQKNHQDTVSLNDLIFSFLDAMKHEIVLIKQLILKKKHASSQFDMA